MSYALGVDLGNTFTRAAICRPGGTPFTVTLGRHQLMPSVVRARHDGALTVGDVTPDSARDLRRRLGDSTPVILNGTPHSPPELLATALAEVHAQVSRLQGEPPEQVVLTCPASWGRYRQDQFALVPVLAEISLDAVTVITDSMAAARLHAISHPLRDGDLLAVYDLGGTTFDTCVIRYGEGLLGVPQGMPWIGGDVIDQVVFDHVDQLTGGAISALDPEDANDGRALRQIRFTCARVKERMLGQTSLDLPIVTPGREHQVTIAGTDFDRLIRPAITATVRAMDRSLASAGVAAKDLSGVLLSGGCSQIPIVRHTIEEELGCPVLSGPAAQHAVAQGAATFGADRLEVPSSAAPDELVGTEVELPQTDSGLRRLVWTALALALATGTLAFWLTRLLWPH